MIHILKGDDSATHTMNVTPPAGVDLTGYRIRFECDGLVREFPIGEPASFDFPAEWTARQALGRKMCRWQLIAPDGRRTTTDNTFCVYVTNVVQDVSPANAGNIRFTLDRPLDGIALDPNATSAQLMSFLVEVVTRLGGTVNPS